MTSVSDVGRTAFVPGHQVPRIPIAPRAEWVDDPALRIPEEVTVSATPPDDDSYSFWDVLDLINPLQHIPVVNVLYREVTGDTIKTPAKLIGATLLGGPIGFAAAMVDSMIDETTGKDIGEHVMAMFKPDAGAPASLPETQVASAAPSAGKVPASADEIVDDPALRARIPIPASLPSIPAAAPREYVPQVAAAPAPSEAEARIVAARIAGQANVLGPLKRDPVTPGETKKAAAPTIVAARGEMRFMPLNRGAAETRARAAPARREVEPVSLSELKAQARFAPGPLNVGGANLSPATLAVATAAQTVPRPSAQEIHEYGRQASAGDAPAEMPGWFDGAMLDAIDKYRAMKQDLGAAN